MGSDSDLLTALTAGIGREKPDATDAIVRGFAWARVSTDMQEEMGLSIPAQLREIRDFAERRGMEVVREYIETGSAFKKGTKRPEFDRMIEAAKADPGIAVILVHDLSRFSRDSARGRSLIQELREHSVDVISLNDPEFDPESVAGVYMESILHAKNEAYSREVGFHTRKGQRSNIRTRDSETGWCYKNGGQPLWGYRAERLHRGEARGRSIMKSIWLPDETVVAGRPAHEWARHCLIELAAKGASLDDLRDFCNDSEIPARRGKYWSTSTWNSLLQPNTLLKYAGYGVWNVHNKNGSKRPPEEWEIVPNAHPALITEDEAKAIADARRRNRPARFDRTSNRSKTSSYILSGGLFVCSRCGSNMIGFQNGRHRYYCCGSQPYRKGKGCGSGVYVPQDEVEAEVIDGMQELLKFCADEREFTRLINEELQTLWQGETGHDPDAKRKLAAIDAKISNVRQAIEDGLEDAGWANERLHELISDRSALETRVAQATPPPRISRQEAMAYRGNLGKVMAHGNMAEKKELVRGCVQELKLAPEELVVQITYQVPEPVMNSVVARAVFAAIDNGLRSLFRRRSRLPMKGRRVRPAR
ncbi:MAG TPA: recombinase family protein [Armatimonadota bacterium]|nr:recombinase family protein [Armatimonadota bacterium]